MRRVLAVKRGDVWAYKETWTRGPLVPVRIVDPGTHYDAAIRVRRLDDPAAPEEWTRRNRLPCRWSDVHTYLDAHPEIIRADQVFEEEEVTDTRFQSAADEMFSAGKRTIRQIVREELERALPPVEKLAYTYEEAARATGISSSTLRSEVRNYRLVPRYVGSKPLFPVEELRRWVESLPEDPR